MGRIKRQGSKPFNRPILIYCPGETEREYLRSLSADRYSGLDIVIKPKLGHADKYEEVFEDVRKDFSPKEPSPPCFFVNDMDAIVDQSKLGEYNQAKTDTISALEGTFTVIESMPCIEFWYLLHYRYTDKYFPNYNSLKPVLLKEIPTYQKTAKCRSKMYPILKDKINTAIGNAAKTMKKKGSCEGDCSYTNMHELITMLDEVYSKLST